MTKLQVLKRALIASVINSGKAVWSVIDYPLVIESNRSCKVKDYKIHGNTDDGVSVGDALSEGEYAGKYHLPVVVRGKNYFDLAEVPFSNRATQPYNNGLIATKIEATNRGDKIPISLPVGKTIYLTLDVVDSQISGTATRVTMGFYNSSGSFVRSTNISSTIAHKTYTFTLSEEVAYVQFYFQANSESNVVDDYVTMDNIMLRTEGEDVFENYIEPKTVNIYLNEPIGTGEAIQKSVDGLPCLPQFKGTTVYEAQTAVVPSGIEVQYYE